MFMVHIDDYDYVNKSTLNRNPTAADVFYMLSLWAYHHKCDSFNVHTDKIEKVNDGITSFIVTTSQYMANSNCKG